MSRADFALQIIDAPAVGAHPGSADELAALGLDRHLRLAESTKYQGEAGHCELEKPKNMLDGRGLLMEDIFVDARFSKIITPRSCSCPNPKPVQFGRQNDRGDRIGVVCEGRGLSLSLVNASFPSLLSVLQ